MLKFLQIPLTVSVIMSSDVIFRYVAHYFNQHSEHCKGFFERKIERKQFEKKKH